ncbi:MAG: primosomal protein N', partial [Candidatus Melainabacteria bacterium]|nr:primosomal protein N' [Candidatus Melainabacteria bacterium]
MPYCKTILTSSLQNFSDQLTYKIPENLRDKLAVGSLVFVPFRNQRASGLVTEIYNELSNEELGFEIREIDDLAAGTLNFETELLELIKFTANYYSSSYSEACASLLPSALLPKATKEITLLDPESQDASPVVQGLIRARNHKAKWARLKTLSGLKESDLRKELRKLEKKNLISQTYLNPINKNRKQTSPLEFLQELEPGTIPELTEEQNQVLETIQASQNKKFLLHGVTGSGKTEVYMRLIADTLAENRSTIVLVPEIALAPQLLERLSQRFGKDSIIVWHSALKTSEKSQSVEALVAGEAKIVIGARSAIFAPVKSLGLIVIDEEHENSYKQESPAPRYHARLVAERRAELNDCHLILGSATPCIETYYKAKQELNDYKLVELSKRVNDYPLPKVTIVDMREEFNNANKSIFSRFLHSQILDRLEKQEQTILFLNKRGAASHVFCRNCGHIYKCSSCDSKTVYHMDKQALLCHHCGETEAHPQECPQCQSRAIKFFGLGTQKLEQEVIKAFPEARVRRLDSDSSRQGNNYIKTWQDFKNGEVDILIGTQMIAKGLDNPNLTLVGVISADTNFAQLDYLADERGFQLLTQVAGRAGRRDKLGQVIFQTYQPEREALIFAQAQDYQGFYEQEIELREALCYPPFSKLIRFLVSSESEPQAIQVSNQVHELIYDLCDNKASILGPTEALISKIRNRYRYHVITK